MISWMKSKEIFIFAFILMTCKAFIWQLNIADALIYISLCSLYAYSLYLSSKKQPDINVVLREELKDIRSALSAISIKPQPTKPPPMGRMF